MGEGGGRACDTVVVVEIVGDGVVDAVVPIPHLHHPSIVTSIERKKTGN